MDTRYKIIISLLLIGLIITGGLYGTVYVKEYNSLKEEAGLYNISTAGLSKKEIMEEIENKKQAILMDNELKKLQKKAAEYGISYTDVYIDDLRALIEEYESKRISIKGRIFSIVSSTDKKSRTWLVVGEKAPNADYSEAEVIVNAETPIYKGEERISFDKVLESTEVEIVFSGFVDKNATPVLAFAGNVIII